LVAGRGLDDDAHTAGRPVLLAARQGLGDIHHTLLRDKEDMLKNGWNRGREGMGRPALDFGILRPRGQIRSPIQKSGFCGAFGCKLAA